MPALSYEVGAHGLPLYECAEGDCNAPLPGLLRSRALTEGHQRMFSHVMVGANDVDASRRFYDAVLGAIGHPAGQADPRGRIFYRTKTGTFCITTPIDGDAATHANGGTIGFACASPEQVKAF